MTRRNSVNCRHDDTGFVVFFKTHRGLSLKFTHRNPDVSDTLVEIRTRQLEGQRHEIPSTRE